MPWREQFIGPSLPVRPLLIGREGGRLNAACCSYDGACWFAEPSARVELHDGVFAAVDRRADGIAWFRFTDERVVLVEIAYVNGDREQAVRGAVIDDGVEPGVLPA